MFLTSFTNLFLSVANSSIDLLSACLIHNKSTSYLLNLSILWRTANWNVCILITFIIAKNKSSIKIIIWSKCLRYTKGYIISNAYINSFFFSFFDILQSFFSLPNIIYINIWIRRPIPSCYEHFSCFVVVFVKFVSLS